MIRSAFRVPIFINCVTRKFFRIRTKVVILYQYDKRYRVIWTDGRDFPKELPDNRWYGYSVGKWADNTTFVVNTIGLLGEPRVWLDETGRPMSDQMKVEERFHRVNSSLMEITVTVEDPKFFTRPVGRHGQIPDETAFARLRHHRNALRAVRHGVGSKDFGDPASGIVKK